MSEDIAHRLDMFSEGYADGAVERIALTMEQIQQYNPPPNPAKTTDSRFLSYQALYGDESWELDALEPNVLVDLIQERVREFIDEDAWQATEEEEKRETRELAAVRDHWPKLVKYMHEEGVITDEEDEDDG